MAQFQPVDRTSYCPILFERAAKSWWDPKFDSDILEGQYRRSTFAQIRLRFQYSLLYLFFGSLSWCVYFASVGLHHWVTFAIASVAVLVVVCGVAVLTRTDYYQRYHAMISVSVSVLLCSMSLCNFLSFGSNGSTDISIVGLFTFCIVVLMLNYTVIPLPLYVSVTLNVLYSVVFESLLATVGRNGERAARGLFLRAVLHLCVHIIGAHILIMTQVRMRGTFMKVGQSLLVRRQLEMEKQLKEKMIHSVMPPMVAESLMSEAPGEEVGDDRTHCESSFGLRKVSSPRSSNTTGGGGAIHSLFRPFNMHRIGNVSILFADIVGFTHMSSNKTAEQLVGLLNDLFGRFDALCSKHMCEKIATLGDCYYCVSGCPEPKPDHAHRCVEMGLSMIVAIKQFDEDQNENVNMRVGVHTGTVSCGIVGTKRFKFDVWSNDVSFANRMESTGIPGRVHISETTLSFLQDQYYVQAGDPEQGVKTYFILGRKAEMVSNALSVEPWLCPPSPLQQSAHHIADRSPRKASPIPSHVCRKGSMDAAKKASSLPSILDCEVDDGVTLRDLKQEMTKAIILPGSGSTKKKNEGRKARGTLQRFRMSRSSEKKGVPLLNKDEKESLSNGSTQRGKSGSWRTASDRDSFRSRSRTVSSNSSEPRNSREVDFKCIDTNSITHGSIQQQIFAMNGMVSSDMGHRTGSRVSSFYMASHSTINDPASGADISPVASGNGSTAGGANGDAPMSLHENVVQSQHLRKQSDLQMIRYIQEDLTHHHYFVRPPLSQVTLFFLDPSLEREYRQHTHCYDICTHDDCPPTLATPHFNTYFDILVSAVVYLLVSLGLFVYFEPSLTWQIVCFFASTAQLSAILTCVYQLLKPSEPHSLIHRFIVAAGKWYPWHVCGAMLLALPLIVTLANFSCENVGEDEVSRNLYCCVAFVGFVHFCNFTQLNCWMKNALATIGCSTLMSLFALSICPEPTLHFSVYDNTTSMYLDNTNRIGTVFLPELGVCSVVLIALVWFLNREFEISYRLSFHCNQITVRDRARVQLTKDQADWLLHNIIPRHVAEQLKTTAKYSENHHDVGVIFASIVNFNEMYDETYLGGQEYLRVLNELVGDFDELLGKSEFSNVEKIKTIGSTFMAASGLNPAVRNENSEPYQHLYELMEFALAMQDAITEFNRDLLEFNLILRVGYNFGDVTAGVIGTTKLYYDIWGDAVNVASRMDSTGLRGRIQVSESCLEVLGDRYEFEARGSVFVKGKNNMNVYLLKGRRSDKQTLKALNCNGSEPPF